MKPNRNRMPFYILIVGLLTLILLLPAMIVLPFSDKVDQQMTEPTTQSDNKKNTEPIVFNSDVDVSVYKTESKTIETLPLEDYVKGVVAAEMPANFEMEALKAQALTARTYIIKMLLNPADMNLPEGADITDSILHQVYASDEQLKQIWGKHYESKMKKIAQAVKETEGKIITYDGKPIEASFFSTSNGKTQNSEDYWPSSIPYLRSVESPWDKDSPKYFYQQAFSVDEVESRLNITLKEDGEVGKVISRTSGNYIDIIEIDGKKLKGKDIRVSLGLKSSDFTILKKNDQVIIQTRGYGHGVGMSQYGANGMAQEGNSYKDIIAHYYNGVKITDTKAYTAKLTASN
ncbi:stage II sporulation protein D [Pseudalkalibacillus sp. SCS-8]|uniref:stage II sporulation protein D n=1 Tax=Pseudalkalibacillus nanhaiensis TaxID=3115291 RepID=UPI0032DB1A65